MLHHNQLSPESLFVLNGPVNLILKLPDKSTTLTAYRQIIIQQPSYQHPQDFFFKAMVLSVS